VTDIAPQGKPGFPNSESAIEPNTMILKITLFLGLLLAVAAFRGVAWLLKVTKILKRANQAAGNLAKLPARINLEPEPNPQ
jgi:hypothetical protein